MSRMVRPRPLDPTRKLLIVRDPSELDVLAAGEQNGPAGVLGADQTSVPQAGGAGMGGHGAMSAAAHAPHQPSHVSGHGKQQAIPIPQVLTVPTYAKDYRPDFKQPSTYVRWRHTQRSDFHVEYDLDNEDVRFLENYNRGQQRLTADKMELMIWKLEYLNRDATDRALDKMGATPTDRNGPAAARTVEHLSVHEAVAHLVAVTGLRDKVCDAVFKYWREKRKKRDKPLLRQLEAATNPQDTNPFHVFRPREKQHRPQTRRRRENDLKSYERLRELRENLAAALSIMELVVQRETKKRELAAHEVDEQRLQLRLHHEEGSRHDQVAGQMLQALKDRARRALEDGGGVPAPVPDVRGVRTGRGVGGRRGGLRGARGGRNPASAMAELPLAPLPPEIYAPFDETELDVSRFEKALLFTLPRGIRCEGVRARFGRGGRLVLDRCNPLTVELYWSRDQPDGNGVGEPMDVDGAPPR